MSIKTRVFPEHNYKSIFFNGKTIRIAIDNKKPITELKYPEFYDVKITERCQGNCPYCYQDSKANDQDYEDILKKIDDYFGIMTENQKPFQVALGGGEPTITPYFIDVLEKFYNMGIMPNYTTNGMFVEDEKLKKEILESTKQYCGGVALSTHKHLRRYWTKALELFAYSNVKLNLHVIINDKETIDNFIEDYKIYNSMVDYFVLLPLTEMGRATTSNVNWEYLIKILDKNNVNMNKIAFGANFYPYLKQGNNTFNISLYEPEIMSAYLDMKNMKLYNSSFNLEER